MVKYARIMITRVCFIALTLAGPLDDVEHSAYLPRVQTSASCSNSILTPANVNA